MGSQPLPKGTRPDRLTPGGTAPSGKGAIALASGVAALGGFLFGYDTGVISGALLYIPESLGTVVDGHAQMSDGVKQFIVSSLLVGAIVGAVAGGTIADKIGRRKTLALVSIVFIAGAIGSAVSPTVGVLIAARVVLGLAIGVSSVCVPLYIAEIAPKERRGALVSMNQLMITVGIFASYLVGFAFSASHGWRWMLGLAAVPALLMLAGLVKVSESPRWLVLNDRARDAREVLMQTRSAEEAETEIYEIREDAKAEQGRTWSDVFAKGVRPALILGVGVAAANQLVGVNAVIYYAPTILQDIFGDSGALLSTVGIGLVNVIVTGLAIFSIDRLGRRPLLIGGTVALTLALGVLGGLYLLPGEKSGAVGFAIVAALCVYVAAFAASLGLGIWLVNSEVYPTSVRGKASSMGSMVHWGLDLVIASSVLTLINAVGETGLFWIFGGIGVLAVLFLAKLMPETKGRSLEEINRSLQRRAGVERPEPTGE